MRFNYILHLEVLKLEKLHFKINDLIMPKRTKVQILYEALRKLEAKKEDRINKYIIPLEIKIEETKNKIKKFYNI